MSWTNIGDIPGESQGDTSGRSVSISSDGLRIAIGANQNDDNGNASGHVRIYEWNGSSWDQLGDDIDGVTTVVLGVQSGSSVSLNSDGSRIW